MTESGWRTDVFSSPSDPHGPALPQPKRDAGQLIGRGQAGVCHLLGQWQVVAVALAGARSLTLGEIRLTPSRVQQHWPDLHQQVELRAAPARHRFQAPQRPPTQTP